MNTETLRLLVAKGLSAEDILEIAETLDQPKPRSAAAERQARYRARKKGNEINGRESDGVTSDVTRDGNSDASNTLDKKAPHTPKKINPKSPPISPPFTEKFVTAWNVAAERSGLQKALPLTAERKMKLRRRVAEFGEDAMLRAIGNLAASPFHCGENDRGWRADIGWLLRSGETVTKALEMSDRPPRPSAVDPMVASILAKQHATAQ